LKTKKRWETWTLLFGIHFIELLHST